MVNRKKIILIVPYFNSSKARRWNKRTGDDKDFECYPPLGLMYLVGSINRLENYETKIFDAAANHWSLQQLKDKIYKEAPDIVGITVTSLALNETYNIIENILTPMIPRPLIIIGGPHVTKCPEILDTLGADYGFVGDSEHSLYFFLQGYLKNQDIEKIPGLVHRKEGKIYVNQRLSDGGIDDIPLPDRSGIDPKLYYFSILSSQYTLMITSRGCPFDCIYCGVPRKREYSCRQIAGVIEEMKLIKKQGYGYINICDDIFTLNRDRTVKLCNAIIENNINITWGCATRVDVLDLELLKLMKKAGCVDVRIGIETGSEEIRKEILNKKISNEDYVKGIDDIKKAGLLAVGFFLIGVPGETKKDIDLTIKFACSLPLDYTSFNLAIPLPGSRLHEIALQEKKINQDIWKDVALGRAQPPSYVPDNLDSEYLEKMVRKAMRAFYMRPSYLSSQITQLRSVRDLLHKLKVARSLLE
jgi:radical SAM superfamily enzyme YgiQ (UPF0313 family)